VGTGGFASVPEACDATIRTVECTKVDPRVKPYYDHAYKVYRRLYVDLHESFKKIGELVAGHS
jgi:xylulokinase